MANEFKCCYKCCMRQPGCSTQCEDYKVAKQIHDMNEQKKREWKKRDRKKYF